MSVMVDQSHRNVGVAVITISGECLTSSLYWLISMVGVEVRGHIRDLRTGGHGGGCGDWGQTSVKLFPHRLGYWVDITECKVAVGAAKIIRRQYKNIPNS